MSTEFDPSELVITGVQWDCGCRSSAAYHACPQHKKSKKFLPIRYRYRGFLINIPDIFTDPDRIERFNRKFWRLVDVEVKRESLHRKRKRK